MESSHFQRLRGEREPYCHELKPEPELEPPENLATPPLIPNKRVFGFAGGEEGRGNKLDQLFYL